MNYEFQQEHGGSSRRSTYAYSLQTHGPRCRGSCYPFRHIQFPNCERRISNRIRKSLNAIHVIEFWKNVGSCYSIGIVVHESNKSLSGINHRAKCGPIILASGAWRRHECILHDVRGRKCGFPELRDRYVISIRHDQSNNCSNLDQKSFQRARQQLIWTFVGI